MRLNTKCSIAIHALILISEFGEAEKMTSEMLAKSIGCQSSAIRCILNALQKSKLISIARGVGGAHLDKAPEEITLWEIYSALEPDGLEHIIGIHPNPSRLCPVGHHIEAVLSEPYGEIADAIQRTMQTITLRRILDRYHQFVPDYRDYADTDKMY